MKRLYRESSELGRTLSMNQTKEEPYTHIMPRCGGLLMLPLVYFSVSSDISGEHGWEWGRIEGGVGGGGSCIIRRRDRPLHTTHRRKNVG